MWFEFKFITNRVTKVFLNAKLLFQQDLQKDKDQVQIIT